MDGWCLLIGLIDWMVLVWIDGAGIDWLDGLLEESEENQATLRFSWGSCQRYAAFRLPSLHRSLLSFIRLHTRSRLHTRLFSLVCVRTFYTLIMYFRSMYYHQPSSSDEEDKDEYFGDAEKRLTKKPAAAAAPPSSSEDDDDDARDKHDDDDDDDDDDPLPSPPNNRAVHMSGDSDDDDDDDSDDDKHHRRQQSNDANVTKSNKLRSSEDHQVLPPPTVVDKSTTATNEEKSAAAATLKAVLEASMDEQHEGELFESLRSSGGLTTSGGITVPAISAATVTSVSATGVDSSAATTSSGDAANSATMSLDEQQHETRGISRASLAGMCVECEDVTASIACEQCEDSYCVLCFVGLHRRGNRASHTTRELVEGALQQLANATAPMAGATKARRQEHDLAKDAVANQDSMAIESLSNRAKGGNDYDDDDDDDDEYDTNGNRGGSGSIAVCRSSQHKHTLLLARHCTMCNPTRCLYLYLPCLFSLSLSLSLSLSRSLSFLGVAVIVYFHTLVTTIY